jgi:hypothetical protein
MKRTTEPFLLILLILALILSEGCTTGSPGSGTFQPAGTMPPTRLTDYSVPAPVSVYITYPDFDGGVDAGNVTVIVLVRNFSVVNRIGEQNKPGEGHIVYFKDVTPPTSGSSGITKPGTFQVSALTWCTWSNVSPDTHTFAVELVNNDNSILVPPVIDAVDVTAVLRSGNPP